MPIYEYECEACDNVSEVLRPMADADTAFTCEACGSPRTRRRHSVFAAVGADEARAADGCMRCGDPNGPCAL